VQSEPVPSKTRGRHGLSDLLQTAERGLPAVLLPPLRDIDLARWLNGSYAVPSDDPADHEEAEAQLARTGDRPH
jgi:hypothetical protein